MGDAALKLARRALASNDADGPRSAVRVLRYYVEREEHVAKDIRVWAAMHYLYGQLGDSSSVKECAASIEKLRGKVGSNRLTRQTDSAALVEENATKVESINDQVAAEAKEFSLRTAKAFERSDLLRAKAAELFDGNSAVLDKGRCRRLDGLLWKSRLLRERGNVLFCILGEQRVESSSD